MTKPGPSVTSGADTQPGSDSLFPSGFGGGAAIRTGGVGTGEIADGSVSSTDLNLSSVATALVTRSEFTGAYAGILPAASSYTYNADGTIATETVAGVTTSFTYNGDGSINTMTRSGATRTFSYNADGTIATVA